MKTLPMKCTNVPVDDPLPASQTRPPRTKDAHEHCDEDRVVVLCGSCAAKTPISKAPVGDELPMPVIARALKPGPCGETAALFPPVNWVAPSSRPAALYISQATVSL
mmetsp:Transcript_51009/g.95422  ORF Transcript_51009/g.95422 Transcript_51009/m.95422 type:complete len:107 (-) Transcript_51009:108-428(-)